MFIFRRPYDYAVLSRRTRRRVFGPIGEVSYPALLMINGQIKQYTNESPNRPLCINADASVQGYLAVSGKKPLVVDAGDMRALGVGETLAR